MEALADGDANSQRDLVGTLTALAATRRVWIVATTRLDRMPALLTFVDLRALVTRDLRGNGPEGAEMKLIGPDAAASQVYSARNSLAEVALAPSTFATRSWWKG